MKKKHIIAQRETVKQAKDQLVRESHGISKLAEILQDYFATNGEAFREGRFENLNQTKIDSDISEYQQQEGSYTLNTWQWAYFKHMAMGI